jgi:hypothetical protein
MSGKLDIAKVEAGAAARGANGRARVARGAQRPIYGAELDYPGADDDRQEKGEIARSGDSGTTNARNWKE